MKSIVYYSGVLILSLLPFTTTQAANINWQNSEGGSFGTPGNWSNGVPGSADRAIFGPDKSDPEEGDSYTVTLDQNRTLLGLYFNQGDKSHLILDLGGHSLTLTSTDASNPALSLSPSAGQNRNITLLNGQFIAGQARISGVDNHDSHVTVGNGAVYQMTGETRIGNSGATGGNASMRIEGTGHVQTSGLLILARFVDSTGHMVVTGPDASLTGTGAMYVAAEGSGHLQVLNGATVNKNGNFLVASATGGSGVLEVTGGSSFITNGYLSLGRSGNDSTARALFASGATAQIDRITLHGNSILEINGADITVTGETTNEWNADSTYRIHLNDVAATPLSVQSIQLNEVTLEVELGDGFIAGLGNQYSLLQYSGILTGLFVDGEGNALNEGAFIEIGDYVFELNYGTGNNSLVALDLVAVPEPAHAVLLFVGVLAGYGVWRRRDKRRDVTFGLNVRE